LRRFVLDASVLLPAAVASPDRATARLMAAARAGAFEIVACPLLIDEYGRGLTRPYFRERLAEDEARAMVEALEFLALVLPDPENPPPVLRDANDDYLVALALVGDAKAIVTGDRDLLDHQGLTPPAITPRTACDLLGLSV
jgi:putative PIN family toxin of toxin-antitoxin system